MEARHSERELAPREVQEAALGVLSFIGGLCEKLGLRYWLAYGTAIGAVRHGGFIPWDDDIDVCMPRRDYDMLLEYFDEHVRELMPFAAVGPSFEKPTPFLITRVTDMRYVMEGEFGDEVRLGAFVDVYPLDGLGDGRQNALARKRKMKKLAARYFRAGDWDYYNRNCHPMKRAIKRIAGRLGGGAGIMYRSLMDEALKFDFDTSEFVSVVVGMTYMPFCRREWFEGTAMVGFEGMEAPLPVGYDEILRTFYGNYMQLPPEDDRVGHHFYSLYRAEEGGEA